jgi:hypothetical protein
MKEVLIALIILIIMIIALNYLNKKLMNEIETLKFNLNLTNHEILKTKELLNNITYIYQEELNKEYAKREALEKRIESLEENVNILEDKVKQKGLVNPSYSELIHFIAEDTTNTKTYVKGKFVCTDFSNTFIANFRNKGYYSCLAELDFEDKAHAIVAVNTTDRGLVYVEPQTDQIIYKIDLGDNYCSLVGWDCYWKIEKISSCFEVRS